MESILGPREVSSLVGSLEAALGAAYPSQSPWRVVENEVLADGTRATRLFFQVSRTVGKRQPFHWDTGLPWFRNEFGRWAPLSVVLHINDGLSTFLPCGPLDVFGKFRRVIWEQEKKDKKDKKGKNKHKAKAEASVAVALQKLLDDIENDNPEPATQRSRAGQCLGFHSGEQVHAGTSWDGVPDPLVPELKARVVAYFFALPSSEYDAVWKLPLFNPETPFGLMKGGIEKHVVALYLFHFVFFVVQKKSCP